MVDCPLHYSLSVLARPVPLLPVFERPARPLVIGSYKMVSHVTLAHLLEIALHDCIPRRLIRKFLSHASQLVVFHSHLLSEAVLSFHVHLHLHLVAAVHPDSECTLLHPVVHLAQQNLPVSLRRVLSLVEQFNAVKTLSHSSMFKCLSNVLTTPLVPLRQLHSSQASNE